MVNKSHLLTMAIFTWVGMAAFPIVGWFMHVSDGPALEMECPNHVWNMIEAGSLQREDVTESAETMQRYNCEYVFAEEEPFNPTNWLLFGIITGFTVGTMFLRNPQPTPEAAPGAGQKWAHHQETKECRYCNYSDKEGSECHCPDCVGDAHGENYRMQVEAHRRAPPHKEGSMASRCRVCQRNGWVEEEIQTRMEKGQ